MLADSFAASQSRRRSYCTGSMVHVASDHFEDIWLLADPKCQKHKSMVLTLVQLPDKAGQVTVNTVFKPATYLCVGSDLPRFDSKAQQFKDHRLGPGYRHSRPKFKLKSQP